jgi:RNA polymerase sigma-70 factor (ECF subfamily)
LLLFIRNFEEPNDREPSDREKTAPESVGPWTPGTAGQQPPAQIAESLRAPGQEHDSLIVAEALEGSESAYRELVERYQRPVYSLILRMVRDPGIAEDLTQEAFLKAFRALASYEPERKFSSWLFKIAHNHTLDLLRRKQLDMIDLDAPSQEQLSLQERLADERSISPLARAEASDLSQAMEEVVAELKPVYREVILLRYSEGLAYQEIADILDLNIGTVKTHIHRGRKVMMKALEERGFAVPGSSSNPVAQDMETRDDPAETDRESDP